MVGPPFKERYLVSRDEAWARWYFSPLQPGHSASRERFLHMSKKMAGFLIMYGTGIAVPSLLLLLAVGPGRHVTVPASTGLAAAVFSISWGVAATFGQRGRAWAAFVLIITFVVLLMHSISLWFEFFGEDARLLTVALVSLTCLLTLSFLVYLLCAERPPPFWAGGNDRSSQRSQSNPFR